MSELKIVEKLFKGRHFDREVIDGAYDHYALGAALRPGVRETLAAVCPGGRSVMAGRRDLRQDPRRVVLPVSCR